MATIAQLYDLARSPKNQAHSEYAWFALTQLTKPQFPDFSAESKFASTCINTAVNQTSLKIEENLPIKWKDNYNEFEATQVARVAALFGVGHIPPRIFVKSTFAFLVLVLGSIFHVLKIRRRRRHKLLYGNNAFPPYAYPCIFTTMKVLLLNLRLPWFFKSNAENIDSSVFRLNLPFVKAPMVVAVGDLDTAKEILQDPTTIKSESGLGIISIAGGFPNILTSEGPQWKKSRKAISPAFLKKNLDRMHRMCREETEKWINNKLKRFIDKDLDFDIGREMMALTLSIFCKSAFEYEINPREKALICEALEHLSKEIGFDELHRPLKSRIGILLSSGRHSRKARLMLHEFGEKVLNNYKNKKSLENSTVLSIDETIISCIAKSKKYENDSRKIADIVVFLFSGVERTAYSLALTIFELARNTNVQIDLRNSLNGNDDNCAQEMLKDVLREGMRMHPSQRIGMRIVGRDFYMKTKSIVIPKGSNIFVPSLIVTRFGVESPELFLPSRWRKHPDKSFLLFSTGRRNCVGQSLALAEITWVLSRLFAKYDFHVTSQGTVQYHGTMKCVRSRLKASVARK